MNLSNVKWVGFSILLLSLFSSCTDNLSQEGSITETSFLRNENRTHKSTKNGDKHDRLQNIVIEWSELFTHIDRHAYGMRPNATARAIAYINLAAYEVAASFNSRLNSESNRLVGLEIAPTPSSNLDLIQALNAAYAKSLDHFMINVDQNAKEGISLLYNDIQSKSQDSEILESSADWGKYIANQIIAYAKTDFEAESQITDPQPHSYVPPVEDGYWTYSAEPERALFPYWGKVRTFVIGSEETSSIPPLSYSHLASSEYYAQMREVYIENNKAKAEQGEDLWIAEFWSDDVEGLMMSPPGRQISIASQLIEKEKLGIEQSLILMLKLGYALNDAAVSVWSDKYQYMVMRPNVYIQEFIDPSFQTNLYRLVYWPNPSFPGYPSGHSTFATSAAGVFIDHFGDIPFTDFTHEGRTEFLGSPRSYSTLSEMAAENAYSRIPLGVHVRMDCDEGLRLGYEISDAVNSLRFLKKPQ